MSRVYNSFKSFLFSHVCFVVISVQVFPILLDMDANILYFSVIDGVTYLV